MRLRAESDDRRRERIKNVLHILEQRGLTEHPEEAFHAYTNGTVELRESVAGLIGFTFEDIGVLGGVGMLKEVNGTDFSDLRDQEEILAANIAFFRRLIDAYRKLANSVIIGA